MKKLDRILFLSAALLVTVAAESKAQLAVGKKPVHQGAAFPIPRRPSPKHVWVPTEWVEVGPTYGERPGHWALPPHAGAAWVTGHWKSSHGGYAWVPGYWR